MTLRACDPPPQKKNQSKGLACFSLSLSLLCLSFSLSLSVSQILADLLPAQVHSRSDLGFRVFMFQEGDKGSRERSGTKAIMKVFSKGES